MTLKPIATRISEEMEREIREVMKYEKVDKATAVRIALEFGIAEWRKRLAIELLREGKVTFAKAAEIAKLSLWDFADLMKERRVEWVRFTPEEIEGEFKKAVEAEAK